MRIVGPNGTAAVTTTPAARRAASGTFNLPESETHQLAAAVGGPRGVGGIEALIALQGIEAPEERRRRAVKHGRHALDALDQLKLSLLGGSLDEATLAKLKTAAAGLKDASGDSRLDGVLGEIELRVEVELAKMAAPGG